MSFLKQTALAFALFTTPLLVQGQDYIDTIAGKACECMDGINEVNTAEVVNMKLGICMLNAAKPYAQQLKQDYKIDITSASSLQAEGRKLGEVIGLKAAGVCPEALVKMASLSKQGEEARTAGPVFKTFEGKVTSINEQQFISFTVRNTDGKTANFLWLNFFQSDVDLASGAKKLLQENVTITYREEEFFDPRIKEYKKFNVITSITGV